MKRLLVKMAPLFMLVGCVSEEAQVGPEGGSVDVCFDGVGADGGQTPEDLTVEIAGKAVAVDGDAAQCAGTRTVTVAEEDGAVHTLGFTVKDENGVDTTPVLDLEVGDAVTVHFRHHMSFGGTAGVVVTDADGLVLALERGGWGGALRDGDIQGLTVSRMDEVVAEDEEGRCVVERGHQVRFQADEPTIVTPFASQEISIGGGSFTATAIAAFTYRPGDECSASDLTDRTSWAVHR